jgi:hypothetical protein
MRKLQIANDDEGRHCIECNHYCDAILDGHPLCTEHIVEALSDMELHDDHACYKVVRLHPERGTQHSAMLWINHPWSIHYGYREMVYGYIGTGLAVMPTLRDGLTFININMMPAVTLELWSAVYDWRMASPTHNLAASSLDTADMGMFWSSPSEYPTSIGLSGGFWAHGVKLMHPIIQCQKRM